jgi:hypothetical protein
VKLRHLILGLALIATLAQPLRAQEDESPPPPEPSVVEPAAPTPPPPTATPRPQAGSSAPAAPGTVVFSDNFDASGRMPTSSSDPAHFERGYVEGEYALIKTDPEYTGTAFASLPGTYGDTSLAVDARLVGETANRTLGLYCRIQQGNQLSGYQMLVSPADGRVRLFRFDEGRSTPMTDVLESSAIRRGSEMNRLELGCAGPTISATVNGTRVAAVGDGSYQQGVMRISTAAQGATAQARLDNLVVTQVAPEEPPAVAGPGPYDGGWTGSTTDLGRANSFTVRNNRVVSVTLDYVIEGDSCSSRTVSPITLTVMSPPIENNAFSVTVTRDVNLPFRGEEGLFPGTVTYRLNGRFASPMSAAGDTEITLDVLSHQPPCKGGTRSSWTATK